MYSMGYGNDTGGHEVRNRLARSLARRETEQKRARSLGRFQKSEGRFGHYPELPLGADDQAQQIESSAIEIVTAEIDDRSIDQYHPYAEEVIGRDSILQAMRASGVAGNVASDRAGQLRGRVWRIEEAVLRHHRRYAQICDSRFDADEAVIVVDREHPIHL
jgi:hypothetical protein